MRVNCHDSIVDYLTLKEKKNLFKLHIQLQTLQNEVAMLRATTHADSTYVAELNGHINTLLLSIRQYKTAYAAQGNALQAAEAQIKSMRREIRQRKLRGLLGGIFGGLSAFGAGVGTTFILLKTL